MDRSDRRDLRAVAVDGGLASAEKCHVRMLGVSERRDRSGTIFTTVQFIAERLGDRSFATGAGITVSTAQKRNSATYFADKPAVPAVPQSYSARHRDEMPPPAKYDPRSAPIK